MNLHIGSWIVPLLFTLSLLGWTGRKYHRLKASGECTAAAAMKAKLSGDELAEAVILFFLLWRFTGFALFAWLLWALFSQPLRCGI